MFMRFHYICFVFLVGLLCWVSCPCRAHTDSYWIWAGISPSDASADSILYLYQGHFSSSRRYESLGLSPSPLSNEIFLVYRITGNLPDPDMLNSIFIEAAKRWGKHKVRVLGLQLDFDSPTSKLLTYNDYLTRVREDLPPTYQLSITGLSDWIVFGDRRILKEMAAATDEIVFQLYQNRKHFSDAKRYIKALGNMKIPYKAGLLANDNPTPYSKQLKKDPYFKGVILFLQKKVNTL